MDEKIHIIHEMPKRYPTDGTFELTVRCNLHCKMCLFRHDDSENAEILEKELTAEQWIDLADQVAKAGTVSLLITGGEPLLRPDFCEIWEGIYKKGFLITLYTNATLVTDEVMQTLRKYPPHIIGITVYGSNPDIYEKVTGNADAFFLMYKGVKRLLMLPSKIRFRSTIIKDNYEDVVNIEKLVAEEFGYKGIVEEPRSLFPPVRGGSSDAREVRLNPEDNVKLIFRRGIQNLKEIVGENRFDVSRIEIEASPKRKHDAEEKMAYTLFGCNAGMTEYAISWDGKLLGCQTMGVFHTDALNDGFNKAWRKFPLVVNLPEQNINCSSCTVSQYCESCYASRFAETGSLNGCPKYQCKDAYEIARLINGGSYNGKI